MVVGAFWLKGISVRAEKFFCGESEVFLGAVEALLLFLYGVVGAVCACFVVTFNMV